MLAIAFTFPAGRYHATPWGRHVNEGAVAWPPEPWRLVRALIATWHHKVKRTGKHADGALHGLVETLSRSLPEYRLPAATDSHTRHYMPQPGKAPPLVFDAFAAVSRDEELVAAWPEVDLTAEQSALLDDLLAVMGYLGRAESWVEARRFEGEFHPNCRAAKRAIGKLGAGGPEEMIRLLAPLGPEEYSRVRSGLLAGKRVAKKLAHTLPESLTDAISVETADLRRAGWSQPPASGEELYVRPVGTFRAQRRQETATRTRATTARYILIGKPLPRVEDGVRIGELLRRAVMSNAKFLLGEAEIPPELSGHGLAEGNRHRHAFYLPWDSDSDGRIDRLLLHVPNGMDDKVRRVAEAVDRLWARGGMEWRLEVENLGEREVGGPLLATAQQWESVTPYLHPWHAKRGFDVQAQIRRECAMRGAPEPNDFAKLTTVEVGGGRRSPRQFHRFRDKPHLVQPDRLGSFWRLRFEKPISGPLALGFGCHFGLGLFRPVPAGHR